MTARVGPHGTHCDCWWDEPFLIPCCWCGDNTSDPDEVDEFCPNSEAES